VQASWIVGLALAGCTFDHVEVPVDAPPDVPGTTDADADGVLDSVDNCASVSNPDQRDHDGDMHGDVCDHCPHLPSSADPDGDNDGVGNDCDPRPQTAGDKRMLWEPFDSASAISGWSTNGTGGNWSVANGALTQTWLGQDTTLSAPGTYQRPYVATKFRVTSLGNVPWVGFRTGAVSFTKYFACIMQAGPSLLSSSYAMGTQNDNQTMPWSGAFSSGAEVRLAQNLAAGNMCVASQDALTTQSITVVTAPLSGSFQFYTRDSAAEFDYVFIVEIGP
jgi:hypothetical protein